MNNRAAWFFVLILGLGYNLSAQTIDCEVGSGMGFFVIDGDPTFGFDTDGDGPIGEQLFVANQGALPVNIQGCTVAAFDPLTGQVTYAEAMFGSQVIQPNTGIRRSTNDPWPQNVLPDGPGAVFLIHGPVSVGASLADILPNLIAGLVYQAEDNILVNYNSAIATSTDEFLAAMEAISPPIPTMSQWALMILGLILTSLAVVRIRKVALA